MHGAPDTGVMIRATTRIMVEIYGCREGVSKIFGSRNDSSGNREMRWLYNIKPQ
jgi:hypothetical protein